MCGVFGFIGDISKEIASECVDSLKHRGPDGQGVWQHSGVTLGHCRLAILDLTKQGRQPMSYAEGRYWITYNGEIYNFLEIRLELEKKGYKFQSQSDTEVVLAAFVEWGTSCLEKFNGMWAFGIWDTVERSLFLSRDRFGKKPLFYAFLPGGLAFASEMKGLFPLLEQVRPNIPLVKDRKMIFHYETTEDCIIEGLRRFPAGTYGWYKDGILQMKRYWCTLDNISHDVPARYGEQVECFRELFIDACRLRMRSDVPIGTALSGGLDSSSTIAAVAHIGKNCQNPRQGSDWQHAFVATFPDTPLDESQYAKMVTDHLGIEASFLDIDPLKAIGKLKEYLYLFEDLYITLPIPFMLTYGSMREHGVKVTIDGHGADECFGGYYFDYLESLMDAKLNVNKIKMILKTRYESFRSKSQNHRLPPKLLYWLQWHITSLVKNIRISDRSRGNDTKNPHWSQLDYLTKQLYISTHETILPTLLRNYDRYSMANGVEIRMPFMDYRIVQFAFSLPWSSKIRNGYSKAIIRDAMAPFLPKTVAYRKTKIGFNSPIVDWMKGPLKYFFLDTIHSQSFQNCNLIDRRQSEKKIKYVIYSRDATFQDAEQAWAMISPYFWEEAVIRSCL